MSGGVSLAEAASARRRKPRTSLGGRESASAGTSPLSSPGQYLCGKSARRRESTSPNCRADLRGVRGGGTGDPRAGRLGVARRGQLVQVARVLLGLHEELVVEERPRVGLVAQLVHLEGQLLLARVPHQRAGLRALPHARRAARAAPRVEREAHGRAGGRGELADRVDRAPVQRGLVGARRRLRRRLVLVEGVEDAVGLGAADAQVARRELGRHVDQLRAREVEGRALHDLAAAIRVPEARWLGDLAQVEAEREEALVNLADWSGR